MDAQSLTASLTTEQLKEEVKRREAAAKTLPKPLDNPDFSKVRELVIGQLSAATFDGYLNDDAWHNTWRAVVTAMFGPEFWTWRQKQTW